MTVICDWKITIIDHAETEKPLRQKKLYWYHELKTYTPSPFGLNERDVYALRSILGKVVSS